MDRPRIVTVAVVLLGISLVIRTYGELAFAYVIAKESGNIAFQVGRALVPIGFYAFQAWILWNVARGKNWSRIAMIVVVLFNVTIAYLTLNGPLGQLQSSTIITSIQILGEIVAVILILFAADYFNKPHGAT